MKKGIPCNVYFHTVKREKNRIVYRFVSGDGEVPSAYTVRLGDTDPLTGEVLSDPELFLDYNRMVDHEVYVQGKETRNRLSLDALVSDDGDRREEWDPAFSVPAGDPFDLPEEI